MTETTWRILFLPVLAGIGLTYLAAERWCDRHPEVDRDRVLAWVLGAVLVVTVVWVGLAHLWWPEEPQTPPYYPGGRPR